MTEQKLIADLLRSTNECWNPFLAQGHVVDEVANWSKGVPWRLHFSGPPRCGKTTLIAALAVHLRQRQSPRTGMVTLFPKRLFADKGTLVRQPELPRVVQQSIERQLAVSLSSEEQAVERSLHTVIKCFDAVFVLIDDLDSIPFLFTGDFIQALRKVGISSILSVGPPSLHELSRPCEYGAPHCVRMRLGPLALCETCNISHCLTCHEHGARCRCQRTLQPDFAKEIPITHADLECYIDRRLRMRFIHDGEGTIQEPLSRNIMDESDNCFALAKVSLDHVLETGAYEDIKSERIRLPLIQIRYFNLALHRVKAQTTRGDARLGLAALALVASAAAAGLDQRYDISPDQLINALTTLGNEHERDGQLNYTRLSRATQGWLCLQNSGRNRKVLSFFCNNARTYFFDEFWTTNTEIFPARREFMTICLVAIMHPRSRKLFKEIDCNVREAHKKFAQQPFLEYAVRLWGKHKYHMSTVATRKLLRKFLRDCFDSAPKLQNVIALLGYPSRRAISDKLHVIAEFELCDLVEECLLAGSDIDVPCALTGETAAIVASRLGNLALVRTLTKFGADITLSCHNGHTALSSAACEGHVSIVRFILERYRELNARLINAWVGDSTVLMAAINAGKTETVRVLLDCSDLDFAQKNSQGRTAFQLALDLGDVEILRLLVQRDSQAMVQTVDANAAGRSVLMELLRHKPPYAANKRIGVFKFLHEQGAPTEGFDKHGRGLVHYAAADDDWLPILEILLEKKADPNARDIRGWTSLHVACANGSRNAVNLLVSKGAHQHERDRRGMRPANVAESWHQSQVARTLGEIPRSNEDLSTLLDNAPIAESVQHMSYTPLHALVRFGKDESIILKALRGSDTDINSVDDWGRTALHLAIARRAKNFKDKELVDHMIQVMLQLPDIDLNIADDRGGTALQLAIATADGDLQTALLLVEAGACVATTRLSPRTIDNLFLEAIGTENAKPTAKLIKALLQAGANVFQLTEDTKLPWQQASERGCDEDVLEMIAAEESRILGLLSK